MFTGLIEEMGTTKKIIKKNESSVLDIEAKLSQELKIGQSIAVNGVCLTVIKAGKDFFEAEVMKETLNKSNLKELKKGDCVNLERALQLGSRIDGHIVNGHVDGEGKIKSIDKQGIAYVYHITANENLLKYLVPKGSIAVDGVSLTIVDAEKNFFTVSLVPHTKKLTNLGIKSNNSSVNLEVDILAKYVFSYMSKINGDFSSQKEKITKELLLEKGFL